MRVALEKLIEWYTAQCDGDWEHQFGFRIETLDNPGISLRIDLARTPLENVPLETVKHNFYSDDDWLICEKTSDNTFQAACAPDLFGRVIEIFVDWAASNIPPSSADSSATAVPAVHLEKLIGWYNAQCDGDWEHRWGFKITTLANPGIDLKIDLNKTPLETVRFESVTHDIDSGNDSLVCEKTGDHVFTGTCSPALFGRVIEIFADWAADNSPGGT